MKSFLKFLAPILVTLLILGSIQSFTSLFQLHYFSKVLKKKATTSLQYQKNNGARLILVEDLCIEKEEKEENDNDVQSEYSKSSNYPSSRTIHSLNYFFESIQPYFVQHNYSSTLSNYKTAFLMLGVFKI